MHAIATMHKFLIHLSHALLFFSLNLIPVAATATDTEPFRVCADPNNPPYSDKNQHGFENKIAALFADALDKPLEYTWFPQRLGFVRNTLKARVTDEDRYKCDYIMGVPAGYDRTLTTKPYYTSGYVMLIAKGRGLDGITSPAQLTAIDNDLKQKIKIAMFDRGPGTEWLQRNGFLDYAIPYQSMDGDASMNAAMRLSRDIANKNIDVAIVWGPHAGEIVTKGGAENFLMLPMQSEKGMKFDFPMAMGVRYGDNARRDELNRLIDEKRADIKKILKEYNIPLLNES